MIWDYFVGYICLRFGWNISHHMQLKSFLAPMHVSQKCIVLVNIVTLTLNSQLLPFWNCEVDKGHTVSLWFSLGVFIPFEKCTLHEDICRVETNHYETTQHCVTLNNSNVFYMPTWLLVHSTYVCYVWCVSVFMSSILICKHCSSLLSNQNFINIFIWLWSFE